MSLPSPIPKHTFLPLTAEPHTRYENTSPSRTANNSTSTSPPTQSSEETRSWYHTPPPPQDTRSWYHTPTPPPPPPPSINIIPQASSPPTSSSEDAELPSPIPFPQQHNNDDERHASAKAAEGGHAGEATGAWEKLVASPWSLPHGLEQQKHAWYGTMLGMGAVKVKDDWGFSSASGSRSHTPNPGDGQ